ncbi:LysM peptidoglycan-binding domain-containing protein [Paremcibacter congregatus]|uniref:LysM peptidoglycan-binding domain-containing protein n=1 Tax=Paremcibacter congregatus TaxID=2043170 RepID=UPI003A8F1AAA
MTEQQSKNSFKREKNGSDWVLRASLGLLAVVAITAVAWILFFAEDGARDFFRSEPVAPTVVETPSKDNNTTAQEPVSTILPSFDVVRISRNGTGVIAGRAEPNSDIFIYARDKEIGSAVADRNGEWVLLFDNPLPSGPTELSLKSRMPGKFEVFSSDVVIVAVPERDEERFLEDETSGVIAILSPRMGGGPTRVLQKPRLVNFSDMAKGLSLDSLDYDGVSNVIISGTAASNSRVRLYMDNAYLADVTASEEGGWSHTFEKTLDDQEHVIRIDQLLDGDDVEVRIEQPFSRGVALDNARAKGEVIVRPGNSLWHIARRLYGSGFHYTLIFGANKTQIKDPNLIYPGQKFALPKPPASE